MITVEMKNMMIRDQMTNELADIQKELKLIHNKLNIMVDCIALKANKEDLEEIKLALQEKSTGWRHYND